MKLATRAPRRRGVLALSLLAAMATLAGSSTTASAQCDKCPKTAVCADNTPKTAASVKVGAERLSEYLPLLKGRRVALFSNHTGVNSQGRHTLDVLLDSAVQVVTIFSPEHGFRGTADAGAHVSSSVDSKTGIPIASLYDVKKPGQGADSILKDVDVIVTDIQDVGLRFYTYYISMLDLMNAAARTGKEFMVLDRPNPNGMYVDGPVLAPEHYSGVGRLPIPVVHGMTLGELARMINGERWLKDSAQVALTVVPCEGYTHQTRYHLPVAPSPNLKDMQAIYLYPSTCLFENTPVSLGRGTDMPFEVYGHPDMKGRSFSFTPRSIPGANKPVLEGKECHGVDLRGIDPEKVIAEGINLDYVIDAWNDLGRDPAFFGRWFTLLIGRPEVAEMIKAGKTAEEIEATWAGDVRDFKIRRSPYLLYPE